MGYRTDFQGEIAVDPPLSELQRLNLNNFAGKRHEEREGYPSVYCGWVSNEDGTAIVQASIDGSDYNAGAWMKYIIDNFLQGHTANGELEASGDERGDHWLLIVENNKVFTHSLGLKVTGERKAVEAPAAPPQPPSAPTKKIEVGFTNIEHYVTILEVPESFDLTEDKYQIYEMVNNEDHMGRENQHNGYIDIDSVEEVP